MLALQLGGKLMHDAYGNRMEPSDGDIFRKARASRPFARSPQLEEGLWKEKSIIMSHSVRESVYKQRIIGSVFRGIYGPGRALSTNPQWSCLRLGHRSNYSGLRKSLQLYASQAPISELSEPCLTATILDTSVTVTQQ